MLQLLLSYMYCAVCLDILSQLDLAGFVMILMSHLHYTTYSKDQLIAIRNSSSYVSNGYVSVLKENGIFKHQGTRAGIQTRNKVHKISTISSQSRKPSQNESSHGINVSNLTKVDITKHIPAKCESKITVS